MTGRPTRAGGHRNVVELRGREDGWDREPLGTLAAQDPQADERRRDEERDPPCAAVPGGLHVARRRPALGRGTSATAG